MGLRVSDLSFRYPGMTRDALSEVSFEVPAGHPLVVLGAFGAGKSTLLRILAGLEAPRSGTIEFEQDGVVDGDFLRGNVSMVFQNYALMPNLSIEQNIALHRAGGPKDEVAADVRHVAELLGLDGSLTEKARELAPSQRMRVAFARALVRRPRLLLLDEPLAHLDNTFSTDLREDLAQAIAATGVTTLLATDDAAEASSLGGQVIELVEGRVVGAETAGAGIGAPETLAAHQRGIAPDAPGHSVPLPVGAPLPGGAPLPPAPRNGAPEGVAAPAAPPRPEAYVNHVPVEIQPDGSALLAGTPLDVHTDPAFVGTRVHAAIRADDLVVVEPGRGLGVEISDVTFDGVTTTVFGRARMSAAMRPVRLEIALAGDVRPTLGAEIHVAPRPGAARLVDRAAGRAIPTITIER